MFSESDSSRPLASGTCTHQRRTMPLRLHATAPTRRAFVAHAVLAGLVFGACTAPTDRAGLSLSAAPATSVAHSSTKSSVTSRVSAQQRAAQSPADAVSGADTVSPTNAVSPADTFAVLTRRRVACLTNPQRCDVADFTAPGSSEARRMGNTVARFRREGLRLSPQRGRLELVVNAITLDPVSGDVIVDSCERDSHVLVDARFTALGEIIVDESVVTTRARWRLVDTARTAVATSDDRDRAPRWRVSHVDIVTRHHGGVPCSQL